jgi:hypothetical protein
MGQRPKEDAMKAKTVWIVAGAVLLGGSVVAARGAKSMHERCKEACARMAGKGAPAEAESHHGCGPSSSEEGEAGHACGPAACRK